VGDKKFTFDNVNLSREENSKQNPCRPENFGTTRHQIRLLVADDPFIDAYEVCQKLRLNYDRSKGYVRKELSLARRGAHNLRYGAKLHPSEGRREL
jgi:hypothetical protein